MILNYAIFNNEEFVAWQNEKPRRIVQMMPVVRHIAGDVGATDTKLSSVFDLFVIYQED